jgi:hypothetical protein
MELKSACRCSSRWLWVWIHKNWKSPKSVVSSNPGQFSSERFYVFCLLKSRREDKWPSSKHVYHYRVPEEGSKFSISGTRMVNKHEGEVKEQERNSLGPNMWSIQHANYNYACHIKIFMNTLERACFSKLIQGWKTTKIVISLILNTMYIIEFVISSV